MTLQEQHLQGVFLKSLFTTVQQHLGTTTTAYTTTEELATATGYTRPGNTLTNTGVGVSTVTSFTDFSDTSWTSASFTCRGCLIYNSSTITGLDN